MKKRYLRNVLALLLALLCFVQPALAAEADVVLAYKVHCDIGFIDSVENVINMWRTTFIDNMLSAIEGTADQPEGERYVATLPGYPLMKIAEDWDGQTAERKAKIDEAIKSGEITTHAFADTPMLEALDLEDAVRLMSYSSEICREYGLELPRSIKLSDVPSQSWLLPTLLYHAGIQFLHMGCNPGSTLPDVPPLFWWEGVDGSKILVMSSNDYATKTPWPKDWPYPVWLDFDVRNESAQPPTAAQVISDVKAIKDAGHTPVIGTMDDFVDMVWACLEDGSIKEGDIPTIKGDMPDTWIHGIASSPTETKMNRNLRLENMELEALSTLLSVWGVDAPNTESAVNSAFENAMLFNEHNWGLNEQVEDYGSTFTNNLQNGAYEWLMSTWEEHDGFAEAMDAAVTPALEQNLELLAEAVQADEERIVVFNGLGWQRDGVVTVSVPGNAPQYLKNVATGEIVPVSADGGQITFTAHDVPAMGYATYVYSEDAPESSASLTVDEAANVIENQYYKITLDPATGSIRSILDKQDGNRELVSDQSDYDFSHYFNERFSAEELDHYNSAYNDGKGGWVTDDMSKTGIRNNYREYKYSKTSPEDLTVTYAQDDAKVTATLTAPASHPEPDARGVAGNTYDGMSIQVTLYADQPYIDITWSMDNKKADPWPMADWLSFPFAIEGTPKYRLYRLGGVIDPKENIVNCTNVNNLCLDGGMAILGTDGKGVALCSPDAPNVSIGKPGVYEFDELERGKYDTDNAFAPSEPTVFLNLYNNQWDTGWSTWNGGDWTTSVRVWSINEKEYDETRDLVEPSRETRLSLSAAYADNTDGTLPTAQSGLQLSASGVQVTTFGPNIDGDGTILRLWEQSGENTTCTVTLPEGMEVSSVQPVDLRGVANGDPIEVVDGQFTVEIGHNAPYSVQIDYERTESEHFVSPVTDLVVKRTAEGARLSWKCDSSNASFVVEHRVGNGAWKQIEETQNTSLDVALDFGTHQFRVKSVSRTGYETAFATSEVLNVDEIIDVAGVTASSNFGGQPPERVISREGLSGRSTDATHINSGEGAGQWLTADSNKDAPVWIEFDLGGEYALGETYIWNYNQNNPSFNGSLLNAGFKYVKVLTWDPEAGESGEWVQFTNGQCETDAEHQGLFLFAKGTGESAMPATNLASGDPLDFGGLVTSKVRFEVSNTPGEGCWGEYVPDQNRINFGLSEVMFTTSGGQYDASLSTLESLTVGGQSLNPAFSPMEYAYSAVFPAGLTELSVKAVPQNPDAVIKVNGMETENGEITLQAAHLNSVNVEVTSADGTTQTQYSVNLRYSRVITPVGVETADVGGNPEWSGVPDVNTINGSGFSLQGDDLEHATHVAADGGSNMYMWGIKPSTGDYKDGWITFDLGAAYSLNEMWVWNFNQNNPSYVGDRALTKRGMKNVVIEYSLDGSDWETLNDPTQTVEDGVYQLAMGTGETMTATNLADKKGPVKFGGITARYVRITPNGGVNEGNYGSYDNQELYFGLSEVRFAGAMPETYEISGTVNKGETNVSSVEGLTVKLYDVNDTNCINPFAEAVTDADGRFQFDGAFASGTYVVRVEPAPGQYGPSSTQFTVDGAAVSDANITLVPMKLESISVKTQPKTEYYVGETFDPKGLVLELHDNTTDVAPLAYSEENADDFTFAPDLETALTTADTKVTITYGGCTVELPITVKSQSTGGGSSTSRYTITVTQGEGGRISPSTTSVTRGSDQTFTITANDGYKISDVLVDGKSVGAVSTYTFENVTARHTITAEFEKVEEVTNVGGFLDVKSTDWFAEAVQYVVDEGLMNGTSSNTFSPSGATTRGMIVTILYRQAGSPEVESDGATWWSDARVWAMANGVSDGTNMEKPITREQLATMLYRYAELTGQDVSRSTSLDSFADGEKVSAYAVEALQWAAAEGIVTGKTGGVIDPQAGATRAETATMLMRFCENVLK